MAATTPPARRPGKLFQRSIIRGPRKRPSFLRQTIRCVEPQLETLQGIIMAGHRVEVARRKRHLRRERSADHGFPGRKRRGRGHARCSAASPRCSAVLGPGMLLGEMAVIDNSPRTATARALTDCVLTPIDRRAVRRAAQRRRSDRARALDEPAVALSLGAGDPDRRRSRGEVSCARRTPRHEAGAFDKIRLENELRAALDRGELELRLQPIEEIVSGHIAGYEALVRWYHPERGWVSPEEFIRLAEETSLILPIGDYVLGARLRHAGRIPPPRRQAAAVHRAQRFRAPARRSASRRTHARRAAQARPAARSPQARNHRKPGARP